MKLLKKTNYTSLLLAAMFLLPLNPAYGEVKSLLQQGTVELKNTAEKQWQKIQPSDLKKSFHIRMAPVEKGQKPPEAVLQTAQGEWVVLHDSSALQRKQITPNKVGFSSKGQFQLILFQTAKKPADTRIGSFQLSASQGSFYYKSEKNREILIMVDGKASLIQSAARKTTKKQKSVKLTSLKSGDIVLKMKSKTTHLKSTDKKQKLRNSLWKQFDTFKLPGYSYAGSYLSVGTLDNKKTPVQIERYGKTASIGLKTVPLYLGDKVILKKGQESQIKLNNGDLIRLSNKSSFRIEKYPQAKSKGKSYFFSFFGKMRALIQKKDKNTSMKFKAPTAVIGIKGTDFEAVGSDTASEVSTLEGVVGLSDPDGKGEVDVTSGMTSSVSAGKLPTPPAPIPPAKLKALAAGSLATAAPAKPAKPVVSSIQILSPKEGSLINKLALDFKVTPPKAPIIFKLDGKTVTPPIKGQPWQIKDGQHEIQITGDATGDTKISAKVRFQIDTKPPALAKPLGKKPIPLIQGKDLQLNWNEKLKSAVLKTGQETLNLKLNQTGLQTLLKSDQLKWKTGQLPVEILAKDMADNETKLSLQLDWTAKPEKPPVLVWKTPLANRFINQLPTLTVTADRKILRWKLNLNKKAVKLPQISAVAENQLTIQKKLLGTIKDGEYSIQIEATDEFQMKGTLTLNFVLDKQKPDIKDLKPEYKISKRGLLTINFTEKPANLAVLLNDQPLPKQKYKLNKNQLNLQFKSQDFNTTPGKLQIKASDQAGNQAAFNINLIFEKAKPKPTVKTTAIVPAKAVPAVIPKKAPLTNREKALNRSYNESIAKKSGNLEDMIFEADKSPLQVFPEHPYFQKTVPNSEINLKQVPFRNLYKLEEINN